MVLLLFAVMAFAKSGWPETGDRRSAADWFSPAGLTLSRVHRRPVRVDLRLLGMGHRADRQRGVQGRREDPGPSGAAVRRVDPADLPAGRRRDPDVRRASATEGLGLGNEETSDNVFGALAEPVMGEPLHLLLFLAVLASSAASLITTFLPTSRTMLAMAHLQGAARHGSPPSTPRHLTPSLRDGHRGRRRRRCSTPC